MNNVAHSRAAASAAQPAAPAEPRLSVEQASYAYAAAERAAPLFTLEATSLQARRKEVLAIVGPNASGKSTLLRLLSGALRPLSGRVQLDGFDVSALDARTRARRIAVVQQESPLLFPVRVDEYVLQGRHPYGQALRFETAKDIAIAEHALIQVGATHLRGRWMHQISGGEKQKVVLARALAQEPL
ncbi:MAG: ABC transporter ATP-binding protein, partial [Acidobacteria bacterium]|nr:ABC transporter ATP-binding protein [Acidobacteriota bacterium]